MIFLVDVNLLLYAYNAGALEHHAARKWLEQLMTGPDLAGLCWQTIMAFIRIGTNHRALNNPFSVKEVCEIVDVWLDQESAVMLVPGSRHWSILSGFLSKGQARGPLAT